VGASVKTFLRILSYLKPFWKELLLSVTFTFLFTIFSSFSILTISPLFKVIFNPDELHQRPPGETSQLSSGQESASVAAETLPLVDLAVPTSPEAAGSLLQSKDRIKEKIKSTVEGFIVRENREKTLFVLCITILTVFLLKNLFFFLNNFFLATIVNGVTRDIRNELFDHITGLSLDYFNKSSTGTLISRITNDVTVINRAITTSFLGLLRDPMLAAVFLFLIVVISLKLTLIAFAVTFGTLFIVKALSARIRKYAERSQEKMAVMTSILQEVISGIRVVKAFAMEKMELEKFSKQTQKYFSSMRKLELSGKVIGPMNEVFGISGMVVVLWFGGREVLSGKGLAADEFMLFVFALYSLMSPVKNLSKVNAGIQEGVAAAKRVFHVLDQKTSVVSGDKPAPPMKSGISVEGVSFSYDSEPVLRHIDLRIEKGELIAIVGPSGVGKTTLADLIARFYDPLSGRITLDGADIRRFDLTSYRKLLGIVTQETILFNDTVRNNISYGVKTYTEEDISSASVTANAHMFIKDLPEGYDTFIGDRGVRLSGGQRQRLQIARAILKNPPILILDEATSSLDSESELLVQEALGRLMMNRTAIVIAHRLSTVKNAHRIIVLDGGRIVEEGTHDVLLNKGGLYKKLSDLQFSHGAFGESSEKA
jgi:subfamily B ATP-binding cassette protein MsbA